MCLILDDCSCLSLKSGNMIIGWFTLILSTSCIVAFICNCFHGNYMDQQLEGYVFPLAFYALVTFIMSIIHLLGTYWENWKNIVAFLVWMYVFLPVSLTILYMVDFRYLYEDTFDEIVVINIVFQFFITAIILIIWFFFFTVIYSYYRHLKYGYRCQQLVASA